MGTEEGEEFHTKGIETISNKIIAEKISIQEDRLCPCRRGFQNTNAKDRKETFYALLQFKNVQKKKTQ